jgi:glycyl-tRNA synthetase alpha chain
VLLKPAPADVVDQYFDSLRAIGIDPRAHDLRLVEDDWESPTLGAAGLGWQVWMDGTEISQFTYFQQCGGIEVAVVSAELTYGLDRIGMMLQEKDRVQDLVWAAPAGAPPITWGDLWLQNEREWSRYNFEEASVDSLADMFRRWEAEANRMLDLALVAPAYDCVIKCSHLFNLLDARGAISVSERVGYIGRVRKLARRAALAYLEAARGAGLPAAQGRGRARQVGEGRGERRGGDTCCGRRGESGRSGAGCFAGAARGRPVVSRRASAPRTKAKASALRAAPLRARPSRRAPPPPQSPQRGALRSRRAATERAQRPSPRRAAPARDDAAAAICCSRSASRSLPATYVPGALEQLERGARAHARGAEARVRRDPRARHAAPAHARGAGPGRASDRRERGGARSGGQGRVRRRRRPDPGAARLLRRQGRRSPAVRRVATPKGEYVAVTVHHAGRPALDVLPGPLATLAQRLTFPKMMRWLNDDTRFARPVRWLVALFGDEIVPVRAFGLEAGAFRWATASSRPGPPRSSGRGATSRHWRSARFWPIHALEWCD